MQNSLKPATFLTSKSVMAAIAFSMLTFVFTGCSATGPFQPHSAFKQAVLPTGYQTAVQNQAGFGAQGGFTPQFQRSNFAPQAFGANAAPSFGSGNRGVQYNGGYGYTQPNYSGYGQAFYPQTNQGGGSGLRSPFVGGGNFSSGSC